MDVKWKFDGTLQKRYGSTTTNSVAITSAGPAGWLQNSSLSLSTGLISLWNLDETAGIRYDAFASNNLNDIDSTPTAIGIRGLAASFTASSGQYLYEGDPTAFSVGNTDISISTWFYLNSTSPTVERPIVSKKSVWADTLTTILLEFDGTSSSNTFTDSSYYQCTMSAQGNAVVDTKNYKFSTGGSIYFDGTNGGLFCAANSNFAFGTGNFTIDYFINYSSLTHTEGAISFSIGNNAGSGDLGFYYYNSSLRININNAEQWIYGWVPNTGQWYHHAMVRKDGITKVYIDGQQLGTDFPSSYNFSGYTEGITLGHAPGAPQPYATLHGRMDQFRVVNGSALWATNFTPPTTPYYPVANYYEYYLYVNTDNLVTFRVSKNASSPSATVQATSFGAVVANTWYNAVAWHSSANHIGVSVNLSPTTTPYVTGMIQGSAPFMIGAVSNDSVNYMDGRVDITGVWKKVLTKQERSDLYAGGSGNNYFQTNAPNYPWACMDFGAGINRWLMVAAGTSMFASSNLGTSFFVVGSTRTATYQYMTRSKNLLICGSDAYDPPMYWAGSPGTFLATLAPNSAPACKYAIDFQSFLILLNSSGPATATTGKRFFHYELDSLSLTSSWPNTQAFELESSADDEITSAFVVNRVLHVSTRYRIFKLSFTGGNPDWQYIIMKEWGFVPRTVQKVFLQDREWVVGLDWTHKLRAFDGFNEMVLSNNVEIDNGMCDFALAKVPYTGSGLVISNAVYDPIEMEYRLNLAIGLNSSQTTHALVFNVRSLAMYPYSNQQFNCMCMAESANQPHLVAFDRSGYMSILNTGNLDKTTPINDYYYSPFIYSKIPGMLSKAGKMDMFFKPENTSVYFQDMADFSSIPGKTKQMVLSTGSIRQIVKSMDIRSTQNVYQYMLTSSMNTMNPWTLTHEDLYEQQLGIGKGNA